MQPLRQQSRKARVANPAAIEAQALLQLAADIGHICPALSAALGQRSLAVCPVHSALNAVACILAKHLVASVCKRCGCSQSPTTVTDIILTHLSDKQKQRAWRQARRRTRNPADGARALLCSPPASFASTRL
jgi:hypothetical protein